MKTLATLCFFPICIFQSAIATQTYIPNSPDFVVAKWELTAPVYVSTQHIAELIQEAKYPGNSANFAKAKVLLQQQEIRESDQFEAQVQTRNYELLYQKAVVAQYYHQFAQSNKLLDIVIKAQPKHTNAILLKSNMHLLLGENEKALNTCTQLLGLAEHAIVAACANYAKAQKGDVQANLDSLMAFLKSQKIVNQEVAIYLAEIQSSLAKDTGNLELANTILKPFVRSRVPVSFWVLWADIQIALKAPQNVLSTLGPIVRQSKNKDDALLLRLAIAENKIQVPYKVWLPQATARIALREKRQDTEHAYDIALYYLYLNEDTEQAYKWAKINWQQAKLREDSALLQVTKNALKKPHLQASNLPHKPRYEADPK